MTEALTMMTKIEAELATVTDAEVQRATRRFGVVSEDETTLGMVHNLEAKRLWALAERFHVEASRSDLDAKFVADSDEVVQAAQAETERASALKEICRSIFWAQVRDDLGSEAWRSASVGLRGNWLIVTFTKEPGLALFEKILGGK